MTEAWIRSNGGDSKEDGEIPLSLYEDEDEDDTEEIGRSRCDKEMRQE
jgi:hypothetical protein